MKKFTLFAAFAALAMSASAQENFVVAEPWVDQSVVAGKTAIFDVVIATEDVQNALVQAGQTVNYVGANGETVALDVWPGGETLAGGTSTWPGVGYSGLGAAESYVSFDVVAPEGWSGGGVNIHADAGINFKHWNDNTHFHVAMRTNNTAPADFELNIANNFDTESIASVCFSDNETATQPIVAPRLTTDWTAIDITFADLKKLCPNTFNYEYTQSSWNGYIISFSAGAVAGQNFCIDACYFYTETSGDEPGEDNAVGTVNDDANFVVTKNTVNVNNGQGIELYDLSGRLVKSSNSTVLGIDDLGNGVFVVKSGNSVKKIMK